ncbi:helix-turn-helix domain-containing protein [Actinoplanes rectilineatus]|uniref:helix-turn-helix domain-containing protein n=1 Tax=Actinoplanes rectilineatus TaxID=113571 RepID=UPI0005F2D7CE|nr:helix-turn-helix domain-containing protein [Actinoplanes rectilineatus]
MRVNSAEAWLRAVGEAGLPPLRSRLSGGEDFRASLIGYAFGALRVSEAVTPAGLCVRDETLVRERDRRFVQVEWVRRGEVLVEQHGNRAELGPADLVLLDPAHRVRITSTASTNVTMMVPRHLLRLPDGELAGLSAVRLGADSGAPVSSLAGSLLQAAGRYTPGERARLGAALIEVIAVALSARRGRGSSVSRGMPAVGDQRGRIVAFIEARLPDRALAPALIAAAHHISVRRLHQLFEDGPETVAALIRRRRLERCHADLADPVQGGRTVAAIAAGWGFPDPASFSRQFKAAYGLTAGEHRRLHSSPTIVH